MLFGEKERQIREKLRECQKRNDYLEKVVSKLQEAQQKVPEDCKMGPYCGVCIYAKESVVYGDFYDNFTSLCCTKDACKGFIYRFQEETQDT